MTPAALRAFTPGQVMDLLPVQRALWHVAQGQWAEAHEIVQADETPEAAWVHAFLHRNEGDDANAAYWYRRASVRPATGSIDDEWVSIAAALC